MPNHRVERPRHLLELKRLDEQTRVSDLAAAAAAEEASKLFLGRSVAPWRLALEAPEGAEVALGIDDFFDRGDAECADQLFLEIRDADEKAQPLHLRASEIVAEAGPLETAPEIPLLAGVVEARQPDIETLRAEPIQELADGLSAADRDDRDALGVEISALPLCERLERSLVAEPFDQHDRVGGHDVSCEPGAAEPPSCCRPDR